jgi:hypothetical protein
VISLGAQQLAPIRPDWKELTCMDERAPGWYRDPDNVRQHRHWDGQGWTVVQTGRGEIAEEREQE